MLLSDLVDVLCSHANRLGHDMDAEVKFNWGAELFDVKSITLTMEYPHTTRERGSLAPSLEPENVITFTLHDTKPSYRD